MGKVSESKRKANDAWDKKNMKVLSCKVTIECGERFAEYAKQKGTTINALFQKYIYSCIGEYTKNEQGIALDKTE